VKAAVLHGREDVRVQDIEPPPLQPGQVRVNIEAALTCGTDLKVFKRGYHARMIVPPSVFGHEFAGSICEIGEGVDGWKLGDRVVVANSAPCGGCAYCRRGQENLCDDLLFPQRRLCRIHRRARAPGAEKHAAAGALDTLRRRGLDRTAGVRGAGMAGGRSGRRIKTC
jgi:threonine dehydrogenase-like Zn-dependent dehydrogenase